MRRKWRATTEERRGVFIVGCQRSGTSMLTNTFDRSLWTWVYSEGNNPAFENYRLRDASTIARLIDRSPAPVTVLKPICDSHIIDRVLDVQTTSSAIWIYRHYADVARSAVHKWGGHQLDLARAIAAGRLGDIGWRGERLSQDMIDFVREVDPCRPGTSDLCGALLVWYIRNSFYFELGLTDHERVHVVRYEDIVSNPAAVVPRLFERFGCVVAVDVTESIRPTHVSTASVGDVPPVLEVACEELLHKLDSVPRVA